MPAQIDLPQYSVMRRDQRRQRVAHQPHHQHLRLGVAKADIVFEQHRPGLGQHQPGIEDALEHPPLIPHRRDRGQDDAVHDLALERRGQDGGRRKGAHAAGIRAGVAVAEPLVVLRGGERQRVLAVDQREKARLLAFEKILDDDLRARRAEPALDQGGVDRAIGGVEIGARR